MEMENFSKDINKATWRRETVFCQVDSWNAGERWMFVKMSVGGFVWKSGVSVPDVWTAVYWSRNSSSVDSGCERNWSQLPRLFGVTSLSSSVIVQKHSRFFFNCRFHLPCRITRHITLLVMVFLCWKLDQSEWPHPTVRPCHDITTTSFAIVTAWGLCT